MRIGNMIKAGFYPLPIKQVGEHLVKLLEVEEHSNGEQSRWLDPCSGEGEILAYLQHKLGEDSIQTYGVEIDRARYEKSAEILDYTVRSAFEQTVISHKAFPLIYLNPPYNYEMGSSSEKKDLMEYTFLRRSHLYLQDGGIMIYVVPYDRFANKDIQSFLSKHYEDIGLMRFDDEDGAYEQFKQCIFIGKKRKYIEKDVYYNQKFHDFTTQMVSEQFVLTNVNTVSQIGNSDKIWIVPKGNKLFKITFNTRVPFKATCGPIKDNDAFGTLTRFMDYGNGLNNNETRSKADTLKMPINLGQIGLCMMTGMADGVVGEGEHLHLVRGSENVYIEEAITEQTEKKEVKTYTTKRRAKYTIVLPDGEIRELV